VKISCTRAWVLGALAYLTGLVVTGFALGGIAASSGTATAASWSVVMLVVPPLVGALVAVLAVRAPVRPAWHVGLVASLGAVLVAVVVGVLTIVRSAAYASTPPVGALVVPVLLTLLAALGLGALRARRWTPPEGPEVGYTAPLAAPPAS
jgi:hypothetical protein